MRKYHNAGSAGRDYGYMIVVRDWEGGCTFEITENRRGEPNGIKTTGLVLDNNQCRDLAEQLFKRVGPPAPKDLPMVEGDEL